MQTQGFRNQHSEMLKVTSEISARLNADRLSKDATEIRTLLSQLLGKLSVHLAMEDKSLYPKLLQHPETRIRSLAQRFNSEMGSIGKAVAEYQAKWPNPVSIQRDARTFIDHTQNILQSLAKRIAKEDAELYPTVDQL